MHKILLITLLLTSLSTFARTTVSTEGKELHLTCIFNFNPFFIEIDPSHTKAKLSHTRWTEEGSENPRDFITSLFLSKKFEKPESQILLFRTPSRSMDFRYVQVTIPKFMPLYMGKADEPAKVDLADGGELLGSCHVQFPVMPPQW
jgi:hypothetical protein